MDDGPRYRIIDVPVVDGIATLPDGRTVRSEAKIVRFPQLVGNLTAAFFEDVAEPMPDSLDDALVAKMADALTMGEQAEEEADKAFALGRMAGLQEARDALAAALRVLAAKLREVER